VIKKVHEQEIQKKLTFITMNKQQRKLKGLFKYKKRLANYGLNIHSKQYVFETTGKPCSCYLCSFKKMGIKETCKFYNALALKEARHEVA
jgi:hypothetical protein